MAGVGGVSCGGLLWRSHGVVVAPLGWGRPWVVVVFGLAKFVYREEMEIKHRIIKARLKEEQVALTCMEEQL